MKVFFAARPDHLNFVIEPRIQANSSLGIGIKQLPNALTGKSQTNRVLNPKEKIERESDVKGWFMKPFFRRQEKVDAERRAARQVDDCQVKEVHSRFL
ncbi:MAG: hypothetical protein IPK58_19915 [Acidobacteria bacterium]|nr:hypothetical protein [Acidobacteriota bacterium]